LATVGRWKLRIAGGLRVVKGLKMEMRNVQQFSLVVKGMHIEAEKQTAGLKFIIHIGLKVEADKHSADLNVVRGFKVEAVSAKSDFKCLDVVVVVLLLLLLLLLVVVVVVVVIIIIIFSTNACIEY
jgi:hypothetical protein